MPYQVTLHESVSGRCDIQEVLMLYAKVGEGHYLICNIFKKNQAQIPKEKIRQAENRLAEFRERF